MLNESMKEKEKERKHILHLIMKKPAHSSSSMSAVNLSHFLKFQLSCKGGI